MKNEPDKSLKTDEYGMVLITSTKVTEPVLLYLGRLFGGVSSGVLPSFDHKLL